MQIWNVLFAIKNESANNDVCVCVCLCTAQGGALIGGNLLRAHLFVLSTCDYVLQMC